MISLANEITAALALPFLLLVLRGFWPSFIRILAERDFANPRSWMVAMILIADVKGIVRMMWWDIARPVMHLYETGGIMHHPAFNALFNGGINLASFAAALCGLKVLHLTIPEDQRNHWSIWTAAFYPTRIRLLCKR